MKKNLLRILLLSLLAVLLFALPAAAHPPITVFVDGKVVEMDAQPVIENGRTLVPVRPLAEALGAAEDDIEWDAVNRRATITLGDKQIILTIDQAQANVSGAAVQLDVPARIVPPGRTMIPLRFVSEQFGCLVEWDGVNYVINIVSDGVSTTTPTTPTPEPPTVIDPDRDWEDVPDSADLEDLAEEVLDILNEQREELELPQLIRVETLDEVAEELAGDMYANDYFSSDSPHYGTLAERAKKAEIMISHEFISCGYSFAWDIVDSWLYAAGGQKILAEDTRFIGIYLYQDEDDEDAPIYAVCEIITGDGCFTMEEEVYASGSEVKIEGLMAVEEAPIIVYTLTDAEGTGYKSRENVYVNPDEDGTFSTKLYTVRGTSYMLQLGNDTMLLHVL